MAIKYLPDYGWVGAKNRDRNYKPTIKIIQKVRDGVEVLYIRDSVTRYSEGINEYGVSILNTATSVKNDESAAAAARHWERRKQKQEGTYNAPDGILMRRALSRETVKEAIAILIEGEMTGHTVVFDEEDCFILEGGRDEEDYKANKEASKEDPEHEWTPMKFTYKLKKISKKDYVVRTNHGHFLPWLGYQSDDENEKMVLSRQSSDARHETAIKNVADVTLPGALLAAISDLSNEDSQLNPVRLGGYKSKSILKTTGQLMMVPKERRLVYRPIWCEMDQTTNINKIDGQKTKTFLDLQSFIVPPNRKSFLEYVQWIEKTLPTD